MKVAGIDVSSNTVTLVISRDDRAGKPREIKNTPQGHVALINRLRKANVSRVCLEATGLYHLDLRVQAGGGGEISAESIKNLNLKWHGDAA